MEEKTFLKEEFAAPGVQLKHALLTCPKCGDGTVTAEAEDGGFDCLPGAIGEIMLSQRCSQNGSCVERRNRAFMPLPWNGDMKSS